MVTDTCVKLAMIREKEDTWITEAKDTVNQTWHTWIQRSHIFPGT